MYCLIKQPNSLFIEIRVDPKCIGQDCLEKVCEYLGISNEKDYFGLKYENGKGEELWLNLRNPIDRQIYGGGNSPLRFSLRVKFWVPPHLLLQETTRHQFYLDAKQHLLEKRLLASDWDCVCRLIALIAQSESGDYDPLNPPHNIYVQASTITPSGVNNNNKPHDLLQRIIRAHRECRGNRPAAAEYKLLKEIAEFDTYGVETFHAKLAQCNIVVGVGPNGIHTCPLLDNNNDDNNNNNTEVMLSISFTNIISASSNKRTFKLVYDDVNNNNNSNDNDDDDDDDIMQTRELIIKLDSTHATGSLYRAITEKHAFYSCETVRSVVTSQFIRDIKGAIVSMFNEDSSLGKKYVFDIQRTCREVYDNARRAIYQQNLIICNNEGHSACNNNNNHNRNNINNNNINNNNNNGGQYSEASDSQEKLARLLDAMTCKICMDSQIDAVFLPCGHVVACTSCATKCDTCPICRTTIGQVNKLYMPGEFRQQQQQQQQHIC